MRASLFLKGLLCSVLSVFAIEASAASLYIDPAFTAISRGDSVTLAVRLDTDEAQDECINAVDGVIYYPEGITPVDVSTGNSIFSIWVEQPKINLESRTITFAGGIPNGYCGRIPGDPRLTNTLVELVFRSPGFTIGAGGATGSSTADITFGPETAAYLNDGLGTKATLALYGARVELSDTAGATIVDTWREAVLADEEPPAPFSIEIGKDTLAFGGEYFITFNTTDKETGISQYEVMEEPLSRLGDFTWGRADAPWMVARSPYVLEDQSLNSVIRVRAIDKAGNEYVATLIPSSDLRTIPLSTYVIWAAAGFIFLLLIGVLVTIVRAWRRRFSDRTELSNDSHNNTNNYEAE